MEITAKIDIFDNPECCSNREKHCQELYRMDWIWFCHRFARHGIDKNGLPENRENGSYKGLPIKCDQCKAVYQAELKRRGLPESNQSEELGLEKELGKFMAKSFGVPPKSFDVLMSEKYPDIEYQCMFVDEKGFQKYPEMEVIKGYDKDLIQTLRDDIMSLYGIDVIEVEKLKEIPQECHFECEKFGLPKDSAPGHCKDCIHTPPF